jgi:Raf kinase inhibitor-like YbhB/YbcL family protein
MKQTVLEYLPPTDRASRRGGVMKLTSPAFLEGHAIPFQYSSGSLNINPPLLVEGVPRGAQALVLLMDVRNSDRAILTHWLLFNLDPKTRQISEECVPCSARVGANSWGELEYRGPGALPGEHQYCFRLIALDQALDLPEGAGRTEIEKSMKGHIVSEAVVMGRFPAI